MTVLVVSATRAEAAHVPAGLDVVVCGVGIGAYWPMHLKVEAHWAIGSMPRVTRW